MHTHTHTHTRTDIFCFFSSEENRTTMISAQMAADIINWAIQTEFCMFKVNKSKFNVMVAIVMVEALKKMTKTHKKIKNKTVPYEHFFLLIAQNAPKTLKSLNLEFSEELLIRQISSEGQQIHIKLLLNLQCICTHTHPHTQYTHTHTHRQKYKSTLQLQLIDHSYNNI